MLSRRSVSSICTGGGLTCDWHDYKKNGRYKVLVKVFDIFGNDTTHLLEVKV
jgi:hypothetical protein